MSDFAVGGVVLIEAVVRGCARASDGELWVDFWGEGWYVPITSIVENKGQPEPDEPTRYGALVEDKDGDVWVRDGYGGWCMVGSSSTPTTWVAFTSQYNPVTVVFGGVAE